MIPAAEINVVNPAPHRRYLNRKDSEIYDL